jgi:hypothetical protein
MPGVRNLVYFIAPIGVSPIETFEKLALTDENYVRELRAGYRMETKPGDTVSDLRTAVKDVRVNTLVTQVCWAQTPKSIEADISGRIRYDNAELCRVVIEESPLWPDELNDDNDT